MQISTKPVMILPSMVNKFKRKDFLMYFYTWYQWLLFFFIYCFFGWIIESTFVSVKNRHFVNRGFLQIPMLPLYGSGAIIMLWLSLPVEDNVLLVFIFGMIGASVLEYVTGYVMERLFKMKYWDYSKNPFNINGYVCLGTSIAWGFLTIALTEFIHKPIEQLVLGLNTIACIIIVVIVGIVFITDVIISTKEALDLGRVLESMTHMKAELEELQLQMALFKAEATSKVSDLRDDTVQRAANIKGETAIKLATLKVETAMKRNETMNALKESLKRQAETVTNWKEYLKRSETFKDANEKTIAEASSLIERFLSLTERREKISKQLNLYHKRLLRGNPTASSKQFGDALRELKEYSRKKRKN